MRPIRPLAALLAAVAFVVSPAAFAGIGAWKNVGPVGGPVQEIAVDPADALHLVVLDSAANVHETRDRGATWTEWPMRAPVEMDGNALTVRGNALYARGFSAIQRTSDAGRTWQVLYAAAPGQSVFLRQLVVDPLNPRSVASLGFTTEWSTFVSTDDGGTWGSHSATFGGHFISAIAFDPTIQGRVLGIGFDSVWESRDAGQSWRHLAAVSSLDIGMLAFDGGGVVYASSESGISISRDGGNSWTSKSAAEAGITNDNPALIVMRADPSRNGHVAMMTSQHFVESNDAGVSWAAAPLPPGVDHTFLYRLDLEFARDGTLWATGLGGLYRRDGQGQPWVAVTIPTLKTNATVGPNLLFAGGADGRAMITATQRSSDGGDHWSPRTDAAAGGLLYPVLGRPSQVYGVGITPGTTAQLTTDAGATWRTVDFSGPGGKSFASVIPVGDQPGTIYATTLGPPLCCIGPSIPGGVDGAVRSLDGGRTWASIDAGISGLGGLAPSPVDKNLVYAGTRNGVLRSRDGGASWTSVWSGAFNLVVTDSAEASGVYLLTDQAIWSSTDAGATWTAGPLPDMRGASTLVADPVDAGRAYAVGSSLAYETRDRGASWQRIAIDSGVVPQVSGPAMVTASGAARKLVRTVDFSVASLEVPAEPLALDTDLWWNPAESGWGMSIAEHEDGQVMAVWYHYDAQGHPTWAVIPGGAWTDARTFAGTLYETRGPAYFSAVPFDPLRVTATAIGAATLRFLDGDTADLSLAFVDGTRFDRRIVRQPFGPPSSSASADLAGLWWNAAQSGWGIVLHQQHQTVFGTWFVYDDAGRPTWLVSPGMALHGTGPWTGDLYSTVGPDFPGPFDPAKVVATRVGTMTLDTRGSAPWLVYSVSGRTGQVPILREPF